LAQHLQPRLPDGAELVEHLAELLEPLLAVLVLLGLLRLELLELVLEGRELGINPAGKVVGVWHARTPWEAGERGCPPWTTRRRHPAAPAVEQARPGGR